MNKGVVRLPLGQPQAHDVLEDMLAQGLPYHPVPFQVIQRLLQVGGQSSNSHGLALRGGEVDLRLGPPDPAEVVPEERQSPFSGEDLPQKDGLVEASLPQPLDVEGDGDDEVGGIRRNELPQGPGGQQRQGAAVLDLLAVLEAVDQFPDRAIAWCRPAAR